MIEHLIQGSERYAPSAGQPGSEFWIASIMECWRQGVESIIRTGQRLIEAKASLDHGEWTKVREGLHFGERQVQMLMAIASDARLSNPQYIALLPASWGTIYDLTRLDDDELERGFQQHIIRPDMIRADVEQLRPLLRAPSSDGGVEGHARQCGPADRVNASNVDVNLMTDAPSRAGNAQEAGFESGPSEAIMPNGGLAIAHRRVEDAGSLDFFPTPPWATRALVEHVLVHLERRGHCKFQKVWEPACGEGHMAEVLKEYFRDVCGSDIKDYGRGYHVADFLQDGDPKPFDWIITNPPFNDSADFVLKAFERAGTGVAMFVRLAWLESAGRYERIFKPYPPTCVAIFSERVPLHKGRWESEGTTMTAYIWIVWIKGAAPQAPFWIPPGCRAALTRSDDVERFGAQAEGEAA